MASTPAHTSCKKCTTPKQKERMGRILDAARKAFSDKDFHKVLMDDVASAASVGKGTIYRYFPDKESLYFAVIFDGLDQLREHIRSTLPKSGDPEATIRELIYTLISYLRQNRFFFRLMSIEDSKVEGPETPNRKRWHQERRELADAIAQVLQTAHEKGILHIPYPRTSALILQGMVRTVNRHNEDQLTVEQAADEVSRIFLCGMRHR